MAEVVAGREGVGVSEGGGLALEVLLFDGRDV